MLYLSHLCGSIRGLTPWPPYSWGSGLELGYRGPCGHWAITTNLHWKCRTFNKFWRYRRWLISTIASQVSISQGPLWKFWTENIVLLSFNGENFIEQLVPQIFIENVEHQTSFDTTADDSFQLSPLKLELYKDIFENFVQKTWYWLLFRGEILLGNYHKFSLKMQTTKQVQTLALLTHLTSS